MITEFSFYLVAIPAILFFGLSKGGIGGAAGALAVPLMSIVADPRIAAAVMLPLLLVMDATALAKFARYAVWVHLVKLLPGAMLGITLASLAMGMIPENGLRAGVGIIGLVFAGHFFYKRRFDNANSKAKSPSGFLWGTVSGFTSTQIHSGGIPASVYLYAQNLDRWALTGTSAVFFAILNLVKLVPYGMLGQFNSEVLMTSLILAPLAPCGVLLGRWLLPRIQVAHYYPLLYGFLILASARLIYEGIF